MNADEIGKVSLDGFRKATVKIFVMADEARGQWKAFVASCSRRPNAEQRERIAFLRGRLSGLYEAGREIELRRPLELHGSDSV